MPVFIILAAVVVLMIIGVAVSYNGLVTLRNRVENQAAQVDVHLKRRAELIPNLIQTVKGYAKFERSTLAEITRLRSEVLNSGSTDEAFSADAKLGRVCSQVLALVESYPELKANTNFMQLQEELSNTENKIAFARQFYNDTVTKYNTAIQMFPRSVIAGMFGFKKRSLLEASGDERGSIKIDSEMF